MARRTKALKIVKTVDDLTNEILRCRTYGHSWEGFAPIDMDQPKYGWRLSLRCVRCAMERHDTIDRKGWISARRYRRPDNWIKLPDVRTPDLRMELGTRIKTYGSTENLLKALLLQDDVS